MKRYRGDPYWTTTMHEAGKCGQCGSRIEKGARVFIYPSVVLCEADACGGQASRDFDAAAFDEGF